MTRDDAQVDLALTRLLLAWTTSACEVSKSARIAGCAPFRSTMTAPAPERIGCRSPPFFPRSVESRFRNGCTTVRLRGVGSGLTDTPDAAAPLAGVRVIDASRILAGPFCGMLLGDLGADVIKIERPGTGDETRAWGPPFVEETGGAAAPARDATYYLSVNRNKRSVTLNLSVAAGRAVLGRLVRGGDVFVENFRPGTQAALGADWETLSHLNPRLVYCSVSGFGPVGPDAKKLGYDLLMQGATGLMSTTGEA